MSKERVLEKLGLTERGAELILSNRELCLRIISEDIISVKMFCKKHDVKKVFIDKLMSENYISYFSNKYNMGSKVFLFEKEVVNFLGRGIYSRSFFKNVELSLELYLSLMEDKLRKNEYSIIKRVLIDKESYQSISDSYPFGIQNVKHTFERATRRLRGLIRNKEERKYREEEIIELNNYVSTLKLNIISYKNNPESKAPVINGGLLKTKLMGMGLSVRVLNCLKAADVDTIGDLVSFNRRDLLKFRNFSKKSLTELEEFVYDLGLSFSDN